MNPNKQQKLEQLLREQHVPEPPADLLAKIKTEIPERLPAAAGTPATARPWWTWRVAATFLILLGVGYLGYQTGFKGGYEEARESSENAAPTPSSPPAERRQMPVSDADSQLQEKDLGRLTKEDKVSSVIARDEIEVSSNAKKENELEGRRMQTLAESAPTSVAAPPPPALFDSIEEVPNLGQNQVRQDAGAERNVGGLSAATAERVEPQAAAKAIEGSKLRMRRVPAPAPAPSAGGYAEPNDQPYGDVYFRNYGTNPFIDTEDDPIATFGLDVDTASYTVARRYLNEGHLPPADAIRPEEFLNFFDYGDAAPARGDFALYAEASASPFPTGPRYAMVRFGIRARSLQGIRRPSILTFVVDTSGSMAQQNRLGLVKESLNVLLDQMKEEDEIGLVAFSNHAQLLLEPTPDHESIRGAIQRLTPSGSTNAAEGLRVGYATAAASFRGGANNRVILLSDGVANVGATGAEGILSQVEEMKNRGIALTTVGVGMGNFNDVLLEQLANRANGNYAYVDDVAEASRLFGEALGGTLQTIAEDARVQVAFNPEVVAKYRLIGYENRDMGDEKFRQDDVDAGEIGPGHAVTALFEVKLQPLMSEMKRSDEVASLTLRYRPADKRDFTEMERTVRLSDLNAWNRATPGMRLATLVAAYAERLKQSFPAKHIDLHEVAGRTEVLGGDARVRELARLMRQAAALMPREKPAE